MIKPGQLPALLHFSCPGIYDIKNPGQLLNHKLPGAYFIPPWPLFHSCLVVPFHSLPGPFSLLPNAFSFLAWIFFIPYQALFHSCLVLFYFLPGAISFSAWIFFIPAWCFFIPCLDLFYSLPGTFSFLPGLFSFHAWCFFISCLDFFYSLPERYFTPFDIFGVWWDQFKSMTFIWLNLHAQCSIMSYYGLKCKQIYK